MSNDQRSSWNFRFRFALGAILALGWGFLFGVALVRANAYLIWWSLGALALLAFFGSALISFTFHLTLPEWHKIARLLALLLLAASGMIPGLAWALNAHELDAAQFVATTGAEVWDVEWIIAIAGLIAGTWTGWTHPPRRWFVTILGKILERPARLVETIGQAILWVPRKLIELARNAVQFFIALPGQIAMRLPRFNRPQRARVRLPKPQSPRALKNDNGVARVVGIVEDRCPYCLDVIKRKDPRGVKMCDVCHTPHHADCWSITGKCQVPHLNF
ncbi:MAG: hypothetical protein HZC40_05990 [Chloroflexi bacterium]|nr:hypothetical protein [Chloroflexota bacterium]